MPSSITIRQARLVLPQRVVTGDLIIEDGVITEISPRATRSVGPVIDGDGLVAMPGLVDAHLHLDALEDMAQASRGLLAGGITSAVGLRQASNAAQHDAELDALAEVSPVHYGLYVRVDDGVAAAAAARRARGLWLDAATLFSDRAEEVFADAPGLVVVDHHDAQRLRDRWHLFDDHPTPEQFPQVHDVDTCLSGTRRAIELAQRHGTRTHLLHLSTAEETALLPLPDRVTATVLPAHLLHGPDVYAALGSRAVCSPPVRGARHQQALWNALIEHQVSMASGHRPVAAASKDVPLPTTHPGWPTAEWWLPHLLDAANTGRCSLLDIASWVAGRPASVLGIRRKGRLEVGFDGDVVLVDLDAMHTIGEDAPIQTAAEWSPWQGQTLRGWPVHTIVAGQTAWREGALYPCRGRELS